jgi:hypothetical protein
VREGNGKTNQRQLVGLAGLEIALCRTEDTEPLSNRIEGGHKEKRQSSQYHRDDESYTGSNRHHEARRGDHGSEGGDVGAGSNPARSMYQPDSCKGKNKAQQQGHRGTRSHHLTKGGYAALEHINARKAAAQLDARHRLNEIYDA